MINHTIENYKSVIQSLNNKAFHDEINFIMNNLQTKNKLFLETLRMTCIEMINTYIIICVFEIKL